MRLNGGPIIPVDLIANPMALLMYGGIIKQAAQNSSDHETGRQIGLIPSIRKHLAAEFHLP